MIRVVFRHLCYSSSAMNEFSSRLLAEFEMLKQTLGPRQCESTVHRVMVVHPEIRWGRNSASAHTTAELQLNEAVSLVNTLPHMRATSSSIVGTDYSTKKSYIWGAGRIGKLIEQKRNEQATAIMINVDVLSARQQKNLFLLFQIPIFDRYNIVLNIFKHYAQTKEANLQIELAEIPYIRQRIKSSLKNDLSILNVHDSIVSRSDRYELLRIREHSLKNRLKSIVENNVGLSNTRIAKSKSVVLAVVGYTNVGKTSFINKLTGKMLYVEDRPFATLDASMHFCRLPSGIPIHIADTIGFVSNLPVGLFASFQATLRHVADADLIIHLEDVSHPDRLAQRESVLKTLNDLKIKQSLLDSMIIAGNKVDKIDAVDIKESNALSISCLTGVGISDLISLIDKEVMTLLGKRIRRLCLRPGSSAMNYLLENSYLYGDPIPSSDNSFLICLTCMNDSEFSLYQVKFSLAKRI